MKLFRGGKDVLQKINRKHGLDPSELDLMREYKEKYKHRTYNYIFNKYHYDSFKKFIASRMQGQTVRLQTILNRQGVCVVLNKVRLRYGEALAIRTMDFVLAQKMNVYQVQLLLARMRKTAFKPCEATYRKFIRNLRSEILTSANDVVELKKKMNYILDDAIEKMKKFEALRAAGHVHFNKPFNDFEV